MNENPIAKLSKETMEKLNDVPVISMDELDTIGKLHPLPPDFIELPGIRNYRAKLIAKRKALKLGTFFDANDDTKAYFKRVMDEDDPATDTLYLIAIGHGKHGLPCMIFESLLGARQYVYPFRGYCWQICSSYDGQGDVSSTEVIGLCNIIDATFETCRQWGFQSNYTKDQFSKIVLMNQLQALFFQATNYQRSYELPQDIMSKGPLNAMVDMLIEFVDRCYPRRNALK